MRIGDDGVLQRFGSVLEFLMLPLQLAEEQGDGENHFFHKARNIEHVEFRTVAAQQPRTVESAGLLASVFLHRIVNAGEEILEIVCGFYPAGAEERFCAGIPEAVRNTCLKYCCFARAYIRRRLPEYLNAHFALYHRETFGLLVMDVHRRAAIGRHLVFYFQPVAGRVLYQTFKGKPFAGAVFDGVRILKLHG